MKITDIKQLVEQGKIEYIKIGTPDIDGIFRGKRIAAPYFLDGLADGFAQSAVLFGWDIAETVLPHFKEYAWKSVFGDFIMEPDLTTFALVPWEDRVASCICDLRAEQGGPINVSPCTLLRQLVERARSFWGHVFNEQTHSQEPVPHSVLLVQSPKQKARAGYQYRQ